MLFCSWTKRKPAFLSEPHLNLTPPQTLSNIRTNRWARRITTHRIKLGNIRKQMKLVMRAFTAVSALLQPTIYGRQATWS